MISVIWPVTELVATIGSWTRDTSGASGEISRSIRANTFDAGEVWKSYYHEGEPLEPQFLPYPLSFPSIAPSRDFSRAQTYNKNIEPTAAGLTERVIDVVDSHRAEKESTRSSGHMSELSRISREVLRSWFPFNYWATLSASFALQTFLYFLFCYGKLARVLAVKRSRCCVRAKSFRSNGKRHLSTDTRCLRKEMEFSLSFAVCQKVIWGILLWSTSTCVCACCCWEGRAKLNFHTVRRFASISVAIESRHAFFLLLQYRCCLFLAARAR